ARLAQDRAQDPGQEFLAEVQSEITPKEITALRRLLNAIKDPTLADPAQASANAVQQATQSMPPA
ncbi:MAG TPA: hypothetical protein VFH56_07410, partial [Acidimicrobiales bacterium]|nr:hypothetical protein [Acidimicrobiales bacterium]